MAVADAEMDALRAEVESAEAALAGERAKVARVEALVTACEERSPLGLDFERRHPEVTPSLLIPARDLRAALRGDQ